MYVCAWRMQRGYISCYVHVIQIYSLPAPTTAKCDKIMDTVLKRVGDAEGEWRRGGGQMHDTRVLS